ncbi:arsenate reductase [Microbacterium phage Cen1621]|uniref:Arsenate reductase n=1 Tax=Microbacterium phage Cen1621 TaxID=2965191 RepID=A0A9E7QAI6_9CAUD|nr:arsenate reductase [Microbacterium phage Cen1621]
MSQDAPARTVRVYTKVLSRCFQCELTLKELGKLGDAVEVEVYEGIDLPENEQLLALFKSRPVPLLSAPIVTVHDAEGRELDAWAGFIPESIKRLA